MIKAIMNDAKSRRKFPTVKDCTSK